MQFKIIAERGEQSLISVCYLNVKLRRCYDCCQYYKRLNSVMPNSHRQHRLEETEFCLVVGVVGVN